MKTQLTLLVILLVAGTIHADVVMDAAELDRFGAKLEHVSCRLIVDNSKGLTPMTDVRFKINYTGQMAGTQGYLWSDPANPWYGAKGAQDEWLVGGKKYSQGTVFYPPTKLWGPYFRVDPTPENPDDMENDYGIFDTVPAGICWDRPFKFFSWPGSEIKLFHSPAEGVLTADGSDTTLYDSDRTPQTVPEPATMLLLAAGGMILGICQRNK